MNSRSTWLKHTREYLKQDVSGRKYFKIHKNLHNFELSPKSLTPVNSHKRDSPVNIDKSALKIEKFVRPSRLTPDLGRIIKQKDSEIRNLRKLYHEASTRIKNLESSKNLESNKNNESLPNVRSGTLKHTLWHDTAIGAPILPSPTIVPRTKSTQNYASAQPQDFLFKKPIRFTKNRPKIVFTNPITGVPLNF